MVELTIKKRHAIKKSRLATLMKKLNETIGDDAALYDAPMIEIAETASKFNIYIIEKKSLIMEQDTWAFPTLRGAILRPFSGRRIVVDMGTIPYMINGADVMRPGVVSVTDDVVAGSPALVVDEIHDKPLAIVIPQYDAAKIIALERGKVAKNMHYIGDDLWNLEL
ncbi:MAG: RNA-binding protein [Methanocalculaceae archaeon]|jgi:PUA domain protein|nr:RNA-binding protein [Methanocalculaceae archaeon]